jgi:hypothetical protein
VLFVRQPGTPVVSLFGSGGTGIRNDRVLYRLRLYFVILGLKGWHEAAANGRKNDLEFSSDIV